MPKKHLRKYWIVYVVLIAATAISEIREDTFSTIYQWSISNLTESVQGKVLVSRYFPGTSFGRWGGIPENCEILYFFTSIDGTHHESNMISYLGNQYQPQEICTKYPEGISVDIYYDKNNPDYSALQVTDLGGDVFTNITTIIIAAFLAFMLAYGISRFN